jgi:hypothetical protein
LSRLLYVLARSAECVAAGKSREAPGHQNQDSKLIHHRIFSSVSLQDFSTLDDTYQHENDRDPRCGKNIFLPSSLGQKPCGIKDMASDSP